MKGFWSTLLDNIGLVHQDLGIHLCVAPLRSHHSISIRLTFEPWFYSVVDLLLGSLSCCMTQFYSDFSCWTDGLLFDSRIMWYTEFIVDSITARCPCCGAAKQAQIVTHPPPCWQLIWDICADLLFGFLQTWHSVLCPNIQILRSPLSKAPCYRRLVVFFQM